MPVHHADLHFGSEVYSSDGQLVGTLTHVLVDAEGMDLRQIVVDESAKASGHHWYQGAKLLIPDVLIPAGAVAAATRERVDLDITLADVRKLHPYVSYQYTGASAAQQFLASVGGGPVWTMSESAAKPDGELEIEKGEPVMFEHSGELLGHVHDIVYDDGELVGVVVRPHEWLSHDVLIQVRFIDRSDDAALFAHITKDDLEHLTPFIDGATR